MHLGKKVLIHCGYGAGRTGTVLSAIDMEIKNSKYKDSINHIRSHHLEDSVETNEQQKALSEYCIKAQTLQSLYNKVGYHVEHIEQCDKKALSNEHLSNKYFEYVSKLCDVTKSTIDKDFSAEYEFSRLEVSKLEKFFVCIAACFFIVPGVLLYNKFHEDRKSEFEQKKSEFDSTKESLKIDYVKLENLVDKCILEKKNSVQNLSLDKTINENKQLRSEKNEEKTSFTNKVNSSKSSRSGNTIGML